MKTKEENAAIAAERAAIQATNIPLGLNMNDKLTKKPLFSSDAKSELDISDNSGFGEGILKTKYKPAAQTPSEVLDSRSLQSELDRYNVDSSASGS